MLNHASLVSGCICVLLAWDEERQNFIRKLIMLGVPMLVLVIVASGQSQSVKQGPLPLEHGRFHVLEVGQIEQGLAKLR